MGAQNIPPPPPLKNAFWPGNGGRGVAYIISSRSTLHDCEGEIEVPQVCGLQLLVDIRNRLCLVLWELFEVRPVQFGALFTKPRSRPEIEPNFEALSCMILSKGKATKFARTRGFSKLTRFRNTDNLVNPPFWTWTWFKTLSIIATLGRVIFIHLRCWEVLPISTIQRQRCIKFRTLSDFYTPLALNCQKEQHLPAPEVYKNQSPNTTLRNAGVL